MPDLLTLAPGVEVVRPDDGTRLRYSEDEVALVRDFFSLLVFGQNEWAGQPFALSAWEAEAIRKFYGVQAQDEDGTWSRYRRYLYEEIPKKNGKSEFAAGLGLYHLIADGEARPQVGIFAADKTNADIIYQCAKYMVEHTALGQPEHDPLVWCRDSVREIRSRDGGVMKVYSSDASTKHGFSFSAIIIDELHAQPNRRLWDVLTAGSDAARRQQAVIVLTTAGDDPDRRSIGWEIHEKCRRLLAWRRGEPERELDSDLPEWCPIMFGIGVITGDDPDKIDALDELMRALKKEGDSIGAKVTVVASGVPAGLGEPVFDRLDADIAHALMSINAVKGVEIGDGFDVVALRGSQNRDEITKDGFQSNHAGGILGGISSGQQIIAHMALKPTSSITVPGRTINRFGEEVEMITKGRHDPCVGIRAVPIAEAMLAIVLMDHLLRQRAQNADVKTDIPRW